MHPRHSPIILVAPNGARKTKAEIPTLPITPKELAEEAERCADAGATIFHLHVRDEKGAHSLDPERYAKAIAAIKAKIGDRMQLQISTETIGQYTPHDIVHLVKALKPEAISLGIRDLIPHPGFFPLAKEFLNWLNAQKIQVQYICYSEEDIRFFAELITHQFILPQETPYFLLFVLGKKTTGQPADPSELRPLLNIAKESLKGITYDWAVCAFGPRELDCMLEAVKQGGHVRIGFENNHLLANGSAAPNTAALVHQFQAALEQLPIR